MGELDFPHWECHRCGRDLGVYGFGKVDFMDVVLCGECNAVVREAILALAPFQKKMPPEEAQG